MCIRDRTWVDGRRYFSLEEDAALREQIDRERTQLIQAILAVESNGSGNVAEQRRGN